MNLSDLFGGGGASVSSYSGGKAIATTIISVTLTANNTAGYTQVTTQPTVLHHLHSYHSTSADVFAWLRQTPFTTAAPYLNNCHTFRYITNQMWASTTSSTHDLYFPNGIYMGTNTVAPIYIECSYV